MLSDLSDRVERGEEWLFDAHVALGAQFDYQVGQTYGGSGSSDASRAVHDRALVFGRFEAPFDKVIQHMFKVVAGFLSFGHAVIRPPSEVDLSYVSLVSVGGLSHYFSSYEVGPFLDFLLQAQSY